MTTVLRRAWRRLISMRTALVLLFLLAIAAVPGSLLPQRPLNPTKVDNYLSAHGTWGRFLDRIGMFDVFASPWFAAIYLLLAVSLIGCLLPRIRAHARAARAQPPAAPRNLDRLPEHATFPTAARPDAAAAPRNLGRLPEHATFPTAVRPDAAAAQLRAALGRRWRVRQRAEPGGGVALSAEKGYLRETGNLLFHVCLLAALVLIAVGKLFSYQGTVIVQQGQGFCNSTTSYDSWRPGRLAADGRITPAAFCVDRLDRFTASYLPVTDEPEKFEADITYSEGVHGTPKHTSITVNHPLRLAGDRVYLLSHGFAPRVTVHMPDGSTRTDTASFIPTDPNTLLSEGAFKLAATPGTKQDVGIEGFFAPTPADEGNGVITSTSPVVDRPVLGVFVYQGTLNANGAAQSIYSLDKSQLTQIGKGNLSVGQTLALSHGISVTFDGWVPWASIQVSHDPTQSYLAIVAALMVLGLMLSLTIRRRRVWVRITPGEAGASVVAVGGLARSDTGNFPGEFQDLSGRLRAAVAGPVPPAERVLSAAGKE